MDNLFFLSIAVIVLAILFSMILAYRLYRDSQQNEANLKAEVLKLLAEKAGTDREELQDIREEMSALRREVRTLSSGNNLAPVMTALIDKLDNTEKAVSQPAASSTGAATRDDHSVFNHAIRLAKDHYPAEKIVEVCGIDLSEAELIVRMHGQ